VTILLAIRLITTHPIRNLSLTTYLQRGLWPQPNPKHSPWDTLGGNTKYKIHQAPGAPRGGIPGGQIQNANDKMIKTADKIFAKKQETER
jgi:hypothetical protein